MIMSQLLFTELCVIGMSFGIVILGLGFINGMAYNDKHIRKRAPEIEEFLKRITNTKYYSTRGVRWYVPDYTFNKPVNVRIVFNFGPKEVKKPKKPEWEMFVEYLDSEEASKKEIAKVNTPGKGISEQDCSIGGEDSNYTKMP